ncbi:MAG: hypothetical protein JJT76_15905 [Clostridiaceae bacterium]|nr:hypothetical protein [Clostridiaceae bacterium]
MHVIIHRGSHQIGGSCIEVFSDKTRIILDIGEELPDLEGSKPKVAVPPNVGGLFKDEEKKIDAVFISHGHEDHIGLIQNIHLTIPVFIGEKAFRIYNITSRFTGGKIISNPTYQFQSGREIIIGDLSITPYLVDHSGFDAYAFLIKHDNKYIVYTGDFRCHGRKKKATEYFIANLPNNIDLLMVEGTMMNRMKEQVETEEEIEGKAYDFIKSKANPVFVLQSSTNIDRLVSMYRAAKKSRRMFVIDIFTAHIVSQLDNSIPKPGQFKDIRVFYPYHLTQRMFQEPGGDILMKEFNRYWISRKELSQRKNYCMLIRDSMLSDLQHIENLKESGFIYSIWSGYKRQERMAKILNYAKSINMEIMDIHTSGHACIDSLQRIIHGNRPKKIIPIHTEASQLFVEKFEGVYIPQDGEVISI